MSMLHQLVDLFLHLDVHLRTIIETYGLWTYLLLFIIVFCETGLVITPFLPGDSLLFAAGAFAGAGALDVHVLVPLLLLAAWIGDTTNYLWGRLLGPRIFTRTQGILFHKDHLLRTEAFYEHYGKSALILGQFLPIIRTFVPFVAGIGKMPYRTFATYNAIALLLWVGLFVYGGFFFGGIPLVRDNFEFVILGIIGVSLLPVIIGFIRSRSTHAK